MESKIKIASTVVKQSNRLFSSTTLLRRGISSTPYRTAQEDESQQPTLPNEMKEKYEPETGEAEYETREEDENPTKGKTEPVKRPNNKSAIHQSSSTLESSGVHNPSEPTLLQHRKNHHQESPVKVENLGCSAGVEAPPSRDDDEDDREYYLHHKASPLAEIEMADTRKPITRATDGSAGQMREVSGWLPEQLLTAEETMMRTAEMWRRNAMRGDPDSPHGRVLRAMRRDWF